MEGQTVRVGMEGVMKDNGIEFGAFHAGDIQGNGYWKLISCGGEITKYMTEFLQSIPARQKTCSDKDICELFRVYSRGVLPVVGPFGGLLFNSLQETVSFK